MIFCTDHVEAIQEQTRMWYCSTATQSLDLTKLNHNLSPPRVTGMAHFMRLKNLPFSTDGIKRVAFWCKMYRNKF